VALGVTGSLVEMAMDLPTALTFGSACPLHLPSADSPGSCVFADVLLVEKACVVERFVVVERIFFVTLFALFASAAAETLASALASNTAGFADFEAIASARLALQEGARLALTALGPYFPLGHAPRRCRQRLQATMPCLGLA